jgi:peptidoglycan hydrolase-like protein with peptidoglycan-binding domain
MGYYGGVIDGQIGPATQAAIAKFQSQNGIAVTGTITQALLRSLHIS